MSVYIIAEAGVNHNGSLTLAKKLVDVAKDAGVDCVKFQTFVSRNMVSKQALKAEYQKENTDPNESQQHMLRKLELSFSEFEELSEYCKYKCIEFMSTAFDFDSIEFLDSIGMTKWKIPSGEITNLPYLLRIAKLNKPIILSTGMSTLDDIRETINVLKTNGTKELTVLHCTTEYPTSYNDVNLKAMLTIKDELGVEVGYSDHTKGIEVAIAAVALGATMIEKHFTLDRTMDGPDHKSSLEPTELMNMVRSIRNIELSIGNGVKAPTSAEKEIMEVARKSIIASKSIKAGETFSEDNLTTKRPGSGISPMKWFEVIGKTAKSDFEEDDLIEI